MVYTKQPNHYMVLGGCSVESTHFSLCMFFNLKRKMKNLSHLHDYNVAEQMSTFTAAFLSLGLGRVLVASNMLCGVFLGCIL